MHEYRTARGVFGFVEFIAWVLVVVGGIAIFVAVAAISRGGFITAISAALPGIAMAAFGLLTVVFVQLGRAGVDTAERVGRLIQINADGFQYLKKQDAAVPKSFDLESNPVSPGPTPAEPARREEIDRSPKGDNIHEQIEYKGRVINVDAAGTPWVGKQNFFSLQSAKAYINQLPAIQDKEKATAGAAPARREPTLNKPA